MPIGKVKFFNVARGFGFIVPEDGGQDMFVPVGALGKAGLAARAPEQRISYALEQGKNGKTSAVHLQSV